MLPLLEIYPIKIQAPVSMCTKDVQYYLCCSHRRLKQREYEYPSLENV